MTRAAITKMGGFTPEGDPVGWAFDVQGDPLLFRHTIVAGRIVEIGGWTTDELVAVWHEANALHQATRQ